MPVHYAIVDANGKIVARGYGDLPDDAQAPDGQRLMRTDAPVPAGAYWDGARFATMGVAPSPDHQFDYARKVWRFDLGAALDRLRERRDRMLAACDWMALRELETGQPIPPGWRRYRQALRDLPAAVTDEATLAAVQWPQEPQT